MVGARYILRYIYSLKSYVVNLQRKWVLANQSSGRRFSHVKKKNKNKNKNRNKNKNKQKTIRPIRIAYDYFLRVREMMRLIRSHRDVWVSHQNFRLLYSTVYGRLWLSLQRLCLEVTSQIFKEERFSPGVLLLGKWKASRKLEWMVSYISPLMNSRRGKNKMRRELLFLLELFCFLFKQGILLKFIHFQLYI